MRARTHVKVNYIQHNYHIETGFKVLDTRNGQFISVEHII